MRATFTRRGGFTLVELLVAVGIIIVLAGLALMVANSGIIGNVRTTGGSDRIAGWLMQARARAQRTGTPQGLRLGPPDANGFIREAILIEVPDPYTMPAGNYLMIEHVRPMMGAETRKVYVVGPNAGDVVTNVAVGDTLSIPSTATIHRVTGIGATTNITIGMQMFLAVEISVQAPALLPDLGAAALTVAPMTPTPTYSTTTFGFVRQARPVFGEPLLAVTEGLAIDANNCQLQLNTITNERDIVFSPNGEIQNAGGVGRVVLWVRNPLALTTNPRAGTDDRTTYESAGEMTLITVYTRTGAVAIHPVNLPAGPGPNMGHDPYAYTKDGIASGL